MNMFSVAGVGATLAEYDNATIHDNNVMSPTGICPSVGVAGFVMGGGIGCVDFSPPLFSACLHTFLAQTDASLSFFIYC